MIRVKLVTEALGRLRDNDSRSRNDALDLLRRALSLDSTYEPARRRTHKAPESWSFMYIRTADFEKDINTEQTHIRRYTGTLREACAKFVKWAKSLKPYVKDDYDACPIRLDYEVEDAKGNTHDLHNLGGPIARFIP